ncbi:MAG: IscA/HesB family protein [Pseudodesulfovibrio sp.]|nr:IscA/HesB family protein [Pseudodesulfovibrio sp.]
MITITESAQNEFTSYFEGKDIQPIRVHLADGGCSGTKLSLAIDENRDGDLSFEQGAFTFLINKDLAEETGKVTVDMTQYGFAIESENMVGDGGGGCGCGSAGGSCGSSSCGC